MQWSSPLPINEVQGLKFLIPDKCPNEQITVKTLALGVSRELDKQQQGILCEQPTETSTVTSAAEPTSWLLTRPAPLIVKPAVKKSTESWESWGSQQPSEE